MTFTDLAGQTASPLRLIPWAAADGNRYRAVFTNTAGTAYSAPAVLRVITLPAATTGAGAVRSRAGRPGRRPPRRGSRG
jgi:hypothetical protein